MKDVYIIILNYKNWKDTQECLESLFHLNYKRFKTIIIDNNSGNNSLYHLMNWMDNHSAFQGRQVHEPAEGYAVRNRYVYYNSQDLPSNLNAFDTLPPVILIQNTENNGFATGNNLAIQLLLKQVAYIWLLNPDMTVHENALTALITCTEQNPFNSITGCVVKYFYPPQKIHSFGGGKINFNSATISFVRKRKDVKRIDYISGGSLFTHTNHFNDIGLLPVEYFLYWEETDWCYQAQKKGYNINVCIDAVCYDKISTTIGRGYQAEYYYTRNGLHFLSKYKKGKLALALFFTLLRFLKRILTGEWLKAKGVLNGTLAFLNQ